MRCLIRDWSRRHSIASLLILFLYASVLNAQGPDRTLVYYNQVGDYQNMFVVAPPGQVSGARYRLLGDGEPTQFDRLTFVRSVEFRDGRNGSPEVVRGWMYKGTDKSDNAWRIIFGKERNRGANTYPVYYAFDDGRQFTRWLTTPGTRRGDARFSHQVHAVLWANQVDSDRLGLQPFSTEELDPLAPSLAWEAVLPELNQLLESIYGQDSSAETTLIKVDDGRLLFKLSASDNCRASLFETLRYRDVEIGNVVAEARTKTISIGEVSKSRFFTGNSIDLNKVANGIGEVIEADARLLSQLPLRAEKRISTKNCNVLTSPWQELRCGQGYCQYWRMNFGFEIIHEQGMERYKLSMVLDIGERRANEPATNKYILYKSTSRNDSRFDNFQVAMNRDGASTAERIFTTTRVVPIVVNGEVRGGETVNPLESSSLRDILNDGFDEFLKKMAGT